VTIEHDKQDAHQKASASSKDAPRVTYTPHPDATPEDEIRVLALVYKYVLECAEPKKAPEAGDDGVGVGRAGGPPKERSADEGSSA
jgi:transposase